MAFYKLFIPSAGIGSRLGGLTSNTNKTLLKIGGKEIISYIIDKFPEDVEVVIALGYYGDKVKSFLKKAYPKRKFTFIDVDNFDGPGSGLGYTMLCCKDVLQCPFIFCSNDTIVLEDVPAPNENYIGYAKERDMKHFRGVRLDGERVTEITEKGATGKVYPLIGLSGIKDYEMFWSLVENGEAFTGETAAFRNMINKGVFCRGIKFTWFDTGNPVDLEITEKALKDKKNL